MEQNEHSNYKAQLEKLIRNEQEKEAQELMRKLASDFIDRDKDTQGMYQFFTEVYDGLYHEIIFDKIRIKNNTRRLLETLATPIYKKPEEEQQKIFEELL